MSKINLDIDFIEVVERIEREKKDYKPSEWAEKVGVSRNVVTNIHGSVKQKPSLEYIIAVSLVTGKPVEYFLWGKIRDKKVTNKRKFEILDQAEEWLTEQVNEDPEREDWFKVELKKAFPEFKKWKEEKEESEAQKTSIANRKVA